jgi:hypothetical protein
MRGSLVRNFTLLLKLSAALLLSYAANADVIDGEELVDPTRPLFSVNNPAEAEDLTDLYRTIVPASFDISFIRASSSNPIAVINSLQVTIGDVIGGALVSRIDRDSVTLLVNDEERIISLYKTSVKSAAVTR